MFYEEIFYLVKKMKEYLNKVKEFFLYHEDTILFSFLTIESNIKTHTLNYTFL